MHDDRRRVICLGQSLQVIGEFVTKESFVCVCLGHGANFFHIFLPAAVAFFYLNVKFHSLTT